MRQDAFSRVVGIVLAFTLHLAVGWALWSLASAGAPLHARVGDSGDRIVMLHLAHPDPAAAAPTPLAIGPSTLADASADLAAPEQTKDRPDRTPPGGAARSTASVALRTTANPAIAQPLSALPESDMLAYQALLEAHLARFRVYPAAARAAGSEGVAIVHFVADREGKVLDAWIETSSGSSAIDRETLEDVLRAQPLPSFPPGWPARMDISLPVTFKLG